MVYSLIFQVISTSSLVSTLLSNTTVATTTATPCLCTAYSQISPAVAACMSITLSDIHAPASSALILTSPVPLASDSPTARNSSPSRLQAVMLLSVVLQGQSLMEAELSTGMDLVLMEVFQSKE
jgi:hypothetical protein